MKRRIVAVIQARMRSSRLAGKVLLPILGRPMLELMIERLRRVTLVDEIVVATTTDPACQFIQDMARRLGIGCFRGSEEDVLDRVLQAARLSRADVIVELTADCPLIDPDTVNHVIETFLTSQVDYCSNILDRTYPRGMDVQVFPLAVLEEVASLTNDPIDREHVSLYIYQHPERFKLLNVRSSLPPEIAAWRLTVDTQEDFKLITRIYERLYPVKPVFILEDVIALLQREPGLLALNRDVQQRLVRPVSV